MSILESIIAILVAVAAVIMIVAVCAYMFCTLQLKKSIAKDQTEHLRRKEEIDAEAIQMIIGMRAYMVELLSLGRVSYEVEEYAELRWKTYYAEQMGSKGRVAYLTMDWYLRNEFVDLYYDLVMREHKEKLADVLNRLFLSEELSFKPSMRVSDPNESLDDLILLGLDRDEFVLETESFLSVAQ